MPTGYEPSVYKRTTYSPRERDESGATHTGLPEGLKGGDRCPRPGCGGLLVDRCVVSQDGTCEEVFCSACSRAALTRLHEPYLPMGREREAEVDRLCQESGRRRASRGGGDEEVSLPAGMLEAIDDTALRG